MLVNLLDLNVFDIYADALDLDLGFVSLQLSDELQLVHRFKENLVYMSNKIANNNVLHDVTN